MKSRTTRPLLLGALLIAPLLALTACAGSSTTSTSASAASSSKKVATTDVKLLSYSGTTISWIGYIGQKEGFFAKNHLNVTTTALPNGQQATASLIGGSVDITILDPGNSGPLLTQGQSLKLLVNGTKNYWTFVGPKGSSASNLKSQITGLKGANVTAPSTAGSGARMLRVLTAAYGVPSTDYTIVADPTDATLTSGTSAAVMTDTISACRLGALGYPSLMNFTNPPKATSSYPASVRKLIGLAGLGYWTTPTWASAHPTAVTEFQKAISQTIAWMKASKNESKLASIMRASDYNVAALTDTQWNSCVKTIAQTYDPAFSKTDAKEWSSILTSIDKIPALPATSTWFAKGLPQK